MLDFPSQISVSDKLIGANSPCYIIAEAGLSHLGNPNYIDNLIQMAADSKVDCIKTQHFYIDDLVSRDYAPDWHSRLGDKQLNDENIIAFAEKSKDAGLDFLCTPHHERAFHFLADNNLITAIKVGSGEIGNYPFLEMMAKSGLPIILSTGLHSLDEIEDTCKFLSSSGCKELAILHCVTSYPTHPQDGNLSRIDAIKSFFPGPVGYSDHTEGISIPLASIALGADILEKHITLFRDIPNAQDWKVSCDASQLTSLVEGVRAIEASLSPPTNTYFTAIDQSKKWAMKGLYALSDLDKGQSLKISQVISKRPLIGLPVSSIHNYIGKTLRKNVSAGEPLTPDHFL